METFNEIANNRVCDLSIWLARYIAHYNIVTMAINKENNIGYSFLYNNSTYKIETIPVEPT